jgi:hypothetical protein
VDGGRRCNSFMSHYTVIFRIMGRGICYSGILHIMFDDWVMMGIGFVKSYILKVHFDTQAA